MWATPSTKLDTFGIRKVRREGKPSLRKEKTANREKRKLLRKDQKRMKGEKKGGLLKTKEKNASPRLRTEAKRGASLGKKGKKEEIGASFGTQISSGRKINFIPHCSRITPSKHRAGIRRKKKGLRGGKRGCLLLRKTLLSKAIFFK